MANIFTDFWYRINKKLVPRNSKVTETSSDFIVELQNANEDEPADRETLVSFSIPKGTSFTPQDREQVDKALTAFENVKTVTPGQWTAIQNLSALETRVTTAETDIDNLENKTNATIIANQATTTTPGYMTTTQVERLNATVIAPATSTTAGYMSVTDKKALDTIKAYSQLYAMFYGNDKIEETAVNRTAKYNYVFKMNQIAFNRNLAHIEDGCMIVIDEPGTYFIIGTGTIVQNTTQSNCLTIRLIQDRENHRVSLNGGVLSGGTWRGSSNTYMYQSAWFNSGTVFNTLNLKENDKLIMTGTVASGVNATWKHQNSKLFLFKMLEAEPIPNDDEGQSDEPEATVTP